MPAVAAPSEDDIDETVGTLPAEMSDAQLLELEAEQKKEDERRQAEMAARLDALGASLARTRAEAIQARQLSGIEQDWIEDEEFYQGIDDANRHEVSRAWRTKNAGQVMSNDKPKTNQSVVFPNITAPYVNAAAAKVSDILQPSDGPGFDLLPTPIPELIAAAEGKQMPYGVTTEAQIAEVREQAKKIIDEAKEKAKKAKQLIVDWDVQCQYHGAMRKVIKDAARIGSGVIKGPVPVKRRTLAWINGKVVMNDKIDPSSRHLSPWNFFPDGACGENIHNGSYTWERDDLAEKQLQDLKGTPGYLDWQIDACLAEGAQRAIAFDVNNPNNLLTPSTTRKFEIWYFHGQVKKEDLEAAGCPCEDEQKDSIPAMLTMVNNRVIRATFNPLDSGDFPYDIVPWQKRDGMPWGKGVGRLGRTAQRIVVAAWRAKMDNAGLGSGPMWIIKNGTVTPIDGTFELAARKGWQMAEDADIDDVRKAFAFVDYPMMTGDLDAIIEKGMKMMEDITGLPMLLQGQQGGAPDILGVVNLLNNNASSVLRELARTFDDSVTEPRVRRYYSWILQHGPDDAKGDFQIDARGSSTNVEREIQKQEAAQLLTASLNPMFGLDPKKTMHEFLTSRHFDPKNFKYDDEEWKQIVENMSKGPSDPRMAVAQLRAQVDKYGIDFGGKLKLIEQHWQEQENARDRQLALVIKDMEQNGAQTISLTELKGKLADTTIKTRTQKELAASSAAGEALKPPTEPAGRAPKGESFQR
jgi:hypothetical protein